MAASADNTNSGARTWPQLLALVIGAVYLLVGIVGFFITGFDDFFAHNTDDYLLWFEINGFHNVVHIVIGVAGLLLARTLTGARTYGWLLAIGYGAAFVYGLIAINETWDFLSINAADNWLHLFSALAGLVIALGPVRHAAVDRSSRV
ncbi:DUF4383 domain-containing protein [Geodermatophilus sp. DF01-2]|uniref:DUF4383 domain-containing protein n=1 Tax=Geodermatophilus sp. DF01-2 TaxID=2559610 RepID=UPI001073DC55|nr:DUF4383 domain-containing protein [Geodermatophilus sp. DF01_2]TFV62732.1 DUF4383 domain-containing protein [Geodermatophilus sp. DF01_2]